SCRAGARAPLAPRCHRRSWSIQAPFPNLEKASCLPCSSPKPALRRHDLRGMAECCCEIEPNPSRAKVVRFGNWAAMQNRAGISDRANVIAPALSELLDAGHHLPRGECRPGGKRPVLVLASGEYLDRSPADIDDQHPWDRRRPRALSTI